MNKALLATTEQLAARLWLLAHSTVGTLNYESACYEEAAKQLDLARRHLAECPARQEAGDSA